MATIERFEQLVAWQKARELTRAVYEASRHGEVARDYGLAGQIQLDVALDAGYPDDARFGHLIAGSEEVSRIVGGLRSAVGRQRNEQRRVT